MTSLDGTLRVDVTMFLKLEGGGSQRCEFKTTYKYVGGVGTKFSQLCFAFKLIIRSSIEEK